jgi:hypothetical protein
MFIDFQDLPTMNKITINIPTHIDSHVCESIYFYFYLLSNNSIINESSDSLFNFKESTILCKVFV